MANALETVEAVQCTLPCGGFIKRSYRVRGHCFALDVRRNHLKRRSFLGLLPQASHPWLNSIFLILRIKNIEEKVFGLRIAMRLVRSVGFDESDASRADVTACTNRTIAAHASSPVSVAAGIGETQRIGAEAAFREIPKRSRRPRELFQPRGKASYAMRSSRGGSL